MKFLRLSALAMAALLQAQNTPAPTPPAAPELTQETVVATTDGKKITVADVTKLLQTLPPQMRGNYDRDPKGFLNQWFMLKKVVASAEEQKLHEKAPYKEGIEIARMQVLWQAAIEDTSNKTNISIEEQKKYYDSKKDTDFTQAKVKLVYIPFAGAKTQEAAPTKKTLSEPEALAKAEALVKEARGGKDFVALVKEHSEDPVSKEKDGDFGPIKRADRLPEVIKSQIFQLKPGQVSEPLRQPNGYYIFRMVEMVAQPFDEVRDAIHNDLKNQRVKAWLESNARQVEVKVERADFFTPAAK